VTRSGEGNRDEAKRQARLSTTLAEIGSLIRRAERLAARGEQEIHKDEMLREAADAIIAKLGETVSRLPQSFLDQHPGIQWQAIKGMRNRLIHHYQHTNYEIVWDTLSQDIPRLGRELGDLDDLSGR
jgi:uncharacterized protein with HEPN domain